MIVSSSQYLLFIAKKKELKMRFGRRSLYLQEKIAAISSLKISLDPLEEIMDQDQTYCRLEVP